MIGSLIGAGIGAIGSIFGAARASREARKAQRMLDQQQRDNQAWYDRRYNEDATQRADAQRMLNLTMERMRQRNRAAVGTAAVMGSSTEAAAVEKAANAQALADTASQIAAAGEARKDNIEAQYQQNKANLTQQQIAGKQQQAQNITNAAQGLAQAAAGAGAAYDASKAQEDYNKTLRDIFKQNPYGQG